MGEKMGSQETPMAPTNLDGCRLVPQAVPYDCSKRGSGAFARERPLALIIDIANCMI